MATSTTRLSLSEHTLVVNARGCDLDRFDFAEIEDYVRALAAGREYQFDAIRDIMVYLWGGRYKTIVDLAREKYPRKPAIQQRFQSEEHFLRALPLPDKLSGVCHLATGTGKSYVMFAVAYLSLLLEKTRRVLVLGPASTVIEQGLTEKFEQHLFGARAAELKEHLPAPLRNRVVKLINSNAPFEPDCILVENINAVYTRERNSLGDSLFLQSQDELLVLSDEVHHAYSHLDFSGDGAAYDFEEGREGSGEDRDERLWMKFLREEKRITRHIGFTGTPYNDDEYFADVIFNWSIKDSAGTIKRVNPILKTETDEGDDELTLEQKFEVILKTHVSNKARFGYPDTQGKPHVKPITVLICRDTRSARRNADEFVKVLADALKAVLPGAGALSRSTLEQTAREQVLCVTSKHGDPDYSEKLAEIEETDPSKLGGKVEYVFAVNKLSEGWDVDNVFQIVPMDERVFDSKLLISQVLGRGLRIPRKPSWTQIQGNFPVVTVTNHEKFARHITELLDQVTECELRFESAPITDPAQERSRHHFCLFNIEYEPRASVVPRTPEEMASPAGVRTLNLTPCAEKLDVKVVYREDTRQFGLTREYVALDAIVYDIERRFHYDKFERLHFDFGDGLVCEHLPKRGDIERVIRAAMHRAGIQGERLSIQNKQEIEIFFFSYLPRGTSKVVRENVEGALKGVTTAEMHRSSARAGGLDQEISVFLSEDYERELGEDNRFVLKGVTRQPRQMTFGQDAWLPSQESFNRDYIRQLVPLKNLYVANTSLLLTPQELVILSHEPERLFLFRLIEHGRLVDSWIKAPDIEFYSVEYEYWRHGRDRMRRSFSPDFFIRLDIDHYLSRLPADAVVTGAIRLQELQNEGIEQLILVAEIKSDDDNTDETRAKEAYAKEHFAALNRRLRETQEVDIAEPFRNFVRQRYVFNLLRPRDYPGLFSRLRNGLVALDDFLRQSEG